MDLVPCVRDLRLPTVHCTRWLLVFLSTTLIILPSTTQMSFLTFPEPPTQATIADARRHLAVQQSSINDISQKIQEAEESLARIIEESRCTIRELQRDKAALDENLAVTLAYLSPIRRLPHEILRQIFLFNFEEYPCCAWVLAAVCSLWRTLVLSMPKLWSRIRLVTTQDAPADTIRLWLERSGRSIPLDIEIFLQFPQNENTNSTPRRRRLSTGSVAVEWNTGWTQAWAVPTPPPPPGGIAPGTGTGTTYVHVPPPGFVPAPVPAGMDDTIGSPGRTSPTQSGRSRASMHWGHIAFYYLTEQMHRWERFVFRFDKHFHSILALRSIVGETPLLREFEISCAEPGLHGDWPWLPCASASSANNHPKMRSLTLQYVPFKWSAPILQNLQSLVLRTLPSNHIALDRVLYIVAASPNLVNLSIHVGLVNPPVLPLNQTSLNELRRLNISGHYSLTALVESLSLPALEDLVFDIDARDPVDEIISSLVARSNNPPLTSLSILYAGPHTTASGIYYAAGALITSWGFLADLDQLKTLQVGGAAFDPLVSVLASPDDDGQLDRWLCPNLTSLRMRGCHAHSDGVAKLVQMVEARNPDTAVGGTVFQGNGASPVKLRCLEVHECGTLGVDVVEWLKVRVEDVVCTEPVCEGSPRSPSYHYL